MFAGNKNMPYRLREDYNKNKREYMRKYRAKQKELKEKSKESIEVVA